WESGSRKPMRTTSANSAGRRFVMPSPMTWLIRALVAVGVALAILLHATRADAEDIDIFDGVPATNDLPNVLIVWDSSANWSASIPVGNCYFNDASGNPTIDGPKATNPGKEQGTKFAIEKCAIYNVINALPVNADGSALFNVGLMLFNEST